MSTSSAREGYLASGVNSILPKEHAGSFVNLPITKAEMDNGFVCSILSRFWCILKKLSNNFIF